LLPKAVKNIITDKDRKGKALKKILRAVFTYPLYQDGRIV
jgi:hypothetical protein